MSLNCKAHNKLLRMILAAGVSCGNDVEVRCTISTISSVSVSVPGRYLLQLFLPFCIRDEAESVKFSSKKQPPTLTVTLAVDSSIAPPAAAQSASASASPQSSSSSSRDAQLRGQHQQQQQQPAAIFLNSNISVAPRSADVPVVQLDFSAGHLLSGPRSSWPKPYAAAADFVVDSGASGAARSMLWILNPHSPPPEDEPEDLLPLTIRTVAVLLSLVVSVSANAYLLVSGVVLLSLLLCLATSVSAIAYMLVSGAGLPVAAARGQM
jgi:hypothetical protein